MNTFIAKMLWSLPWLDIAKYLLAEAHWQRDVALWLEKEQEWYFRLAATAWGALYVADPDALKAHILAEVASGVLTP